MQAWRDGTADANQTLELEMRHAIQEEAYWELRTAAMRSFRHNTNWQNNAERIDMLRRWFRKVLPEYRHSKISECFWGCCGQATKTLTIQQLTLQSLANFAFRLMRGSVAECLAMWSCGTLQNITQQVSRVA